MTITCDACRRVKGEGQVGTSWICEDCKVDMQNQNKQEETK